MNSFYLVLGLICPSIQFAASAAVLEAQPSSLLIPVNQVAVFTCTADCSLRCLGRWIINDTYPHDDNSDLKLQGKGLSFPVVPDNGTKYTIRVVVNASLSTNNTNISCEFHSPGNDDYILSSESTLLVIADSPLSNNPSVIVNTTYVTVFWSPPFLWSGQPVQYFNISVTKSSSQRDTTTSYHLMNHTYSDSVVSFAWRITDEILSCSEITFGISAINSVSHERLQTYNVTESCMVPTSVGLSTEFTPAGIINATALFRADGSLARVEVYIKLPEWICNCQRVNYTLLIENEDNKIQVAHLGPTLHVGTGVVGKIIPDYIFKGTRNYSLRVQLESSSQAINSSKHFFSTAMMETGADSISTKNSDVVYKAVMVIALVVLALMILTVISVAMCVFIVRQKHKKTERRNSDAKQRVCNAMIPNPIYGGDEAESGPVYDSIRPQYETLVAVAPSQTSSLPGTSRNDELDEDKTVRYVGQPQLQPSQLRSMSFASSSVSDGNGDRPAVPPTPPRSTSVSITNARAMALKKNGQERNKLHLTLQLDESGSENLSEKIDESYIVMSPVNTH